MGFEWFKCTKCKKLVVEGALVTAFGLSFCADCAIGDVADFPEQRRVTTIERIQQYEVTDTSTTATIAAPSERGDSEEDYFYFG